MTEEKKGRYRAYRLDLTEAQMKRVLDGEGIRISHEQLMAAPDDVLFLTQTQINHLEKAKANGKGSNLRLSKTQLKYQAMHGSGRFTDFLKKAWSGIKSVGTKLAPVAKKIAKAAEERYGDQAQRLVQDAVATQLNKVAEKAESKLTGKVPEQLRGIVDDAIRRGIETAVTVTNEELRRGLEGARGMLQGAGFFDFLGPSLGGVLNEIGNTAWGVVKPVVTNVASNMLSKRLGGAYDSHLLATYGLARKGKGLKAPGHT